MYSVRSGESNGKKCMRARCRNERVHQWCTFYCLYALDSGWKWLKASRKWQLFLRAKMLTATIQGVHTCMHAR